ncbi:regulatory protein RecX [Polymorphobacter fuscus]|uniref:RecX family transcriptional regulator n=1 Tax=Sandarakinorhabdus fusca TaxID=1439888 RepID=A0A7C9GQH6_9SPHN|nr:regulatory protein RecX [Polymorphobacter fuscus]KAB7646436.1 RecX family transcriptional regulator [Polymorphobacter fuscus]MQT17676.1 RecX family transcriptional regulator [Polymorphobacter fuscus]NJC09779.1 regulatory protein [Polymorphobacter fuscus]
MTKESHDGDGEKRPQRQKRREYAPREPRPIDAAQLQDMALGYAARYATTAAKLRRYLVRKLGERLWTPADPPDIEALVLRLTSLGYVDDRAYAAAKQRDLTARGFGAGRVRGALSAAGVSRDDAGAVMAPEDGAPWDPYAPAIAFARRRRFGPFARDGAGTDPARRQREMAAMARAGHDFGVARRVLAAVDAEAAAALTQDD